jgi:colicin import membrane protein
LVRGFTGSLLLHGGLLAWAVLGFSMSTPLPQPDEIAVEVAEISILADVTKQMKGDTTSKNNEAAPAPDKPSQVVMQQVAPKPTPTPPPPPPAESAPPPPPPEPVKAPPEPPKPEPPKAAEVPPAEDKQALEEMLAAEDSREKAEAAAKAAKQKADAEAKAKAEAKAADLEKKKLAAAEKLKKELAEKKKREDDEKKKLAALAAQPPKDFTKSIASAIEGAKAPELLDKTPKPKGAPPVGAQTASANPNAAKGPNAGSPTGMDKVNQARAEDMLKSQLNAALRECWNKPAAGGGVSAPAVKLKWSLNNDGSLRGEPKIIQTDRNSPLADQAERSAIRAVQSCSPFKLNPELYSLWQENTWNFDPNRPF